MATPHVAGVAALWIERLEAQGSFVPDLLVGQLIGNAQSLPGLSVEDVGAGLVKAPEGP